MLPCSKSGFLYAIDSETINAGIPYADSFIVLVHYCLHKVSDTQTSLTVYGQIKYKKSVWGLVKGYIYFMHIYLEYMQICAYYRHDRKELLARFG